uniref:Uncharacterized protein n=1 Tax=Acrobeloides nanus TaxID=290746 RepID=A0A914CGM2_9BILA
MYYSASDGSSNSAICLVTSPTGDAVGKMTRIRMKDPGYLNEQFLFLGQYYYLFFTYGICCHGLKSTYRTVIGRSTSSQGPYVDKQGKSMLDGGKSEPLVTEYL